MQSQDNNVLSMYWSTRITCSFAILITLQGVPTRVKWLAREYACVCGIIKVQRNAGVGLVKQLDHEKGLSVCWSSKAQRPHIVSLASVGLLYCPSFSHLPFALLHSHTPERGKKVAFHWRVSWSLHRNSLKRGVSQLATTAFHDPEPFPSNKHPEWMLQTEWLITSTTTMEQQGRKGPIRVQSLMAGLLL